MNFFDFAMQMELDNKAHFEKLMEEVTDLELKKIFAILMADEMGHFNAMKAITAGVRVEKCDSTLLETTQNIFLNMRVDENLIKELRSRADGYRYAMKIEAESIRFYEDVIKKEYTSWVIKLLENIVEAEKKHFRIVKEICDMIGEYDDFNIWHKFDKPKVN